MCRAGWRRSASLTYFLLRASGTSPAAAEEADGLDHPFGLLAGFRDNEVEQTIVSANTRELCLRCVPDFIGIEENSYSDRNANMGSTAAALREGR